MTVRVECDLETLEELVDGRIGPVDANVAGRLWVSGLARHAGAHELYVPAASRRRSRGGSKSTESP